MEEEEEENVESSPDLVQVVEPDITQPSDIDVLSEVQPGSSMVSSEAIQVSSVGWQPPPKRSSPKDTTPVLITQKKLDQIVARSRLSKKQSEIMARFLKTNNLLERGVKITA